MDAIKTGGLIAQRRKEKELTQKDLAETLHISTQAVSKWERGLSCPDIGLLEPLAESLDLTVTELLSGQRGEAPGEEAVRDSLRFGLAQLGPKIRRWKWLFILSAVLLLTVVLGLGYIWVRDNTEWLPQRKTVVRSLDTSDREQQIASAMGSSRYNLHLYEVCLADNVTDISLQAELWTHEGMEQSWQLAKMWSDDRELFGARHQLLVLSVEPHSEEWSEEEGRWTWMWFECGVNFAGCSFRGPLDLITNPYVSGGAVWSPMKGAKEVGRGEDLVLLTISIGGPNGGTYAPSGALPPEREEEVCLVVRMYCE